MKDDQKTKHELIEELEAMRQQVEKLESELSMLKSENDNTKKPVSRAPRFPLHATIEFIGDFDIISAKGVNISESGICFESKEDLPFEMQFETKGELQRYRAHLVWARRLDDGGYRFGLKFTDIEESLPTF